MGTEGYLCGVPQCTLQDLIPYAEAWSSSKETVAAANDEEGSLPAQLFDTEESAVALSLSLPFPGLLHIIDNAFKTLEGALHWYQPFFECLQVVTSFLSKPMVQAEDLRDLPPWGMGLVGRMWLRGSLPELISPGGALSGEHALH